MRSLRTLELRVRRQSASAAKLVSWLDASLRGRDPVICAVMEKVQHASLQSDQMHWLRVQMPHGFGAVFTLVMKNEFFARRLPGKLRFFGHATSLGGVESLVEWRAMSDKRVDGRVVRVSVGLEESDDLRADLEKAFQALEKEGSDRGEGLRSKL